VIRIQAQAAGCTPPGDGSCLAVWLDRSRLAQKAQNFVPLGVQDNDHCASWDFGHEKLARSGTPITSKCVTCRSQGQRISGLKANRLGELFRREQRRDRGTGLVCAVRRPSRGPGQNAYPNACSLGRCAVPSIPVGSCFFARPFVRASSSVVRVD
jgi:hypothetical protein